MIFRAKCEHRAGLATCPYNVKSFDKSPLGKYSRNHLLVLLKVLSFQDSVMVVNYGPIRNIRPAMKMAPGRLAFNGAMA